MRNFLPLIQNEQVKLYSRFSTWSMYIILAAIILITALITFFFADIDNEAYGNDWRAQLEAENEEYIQTQEETEFMAGVFSNEIAINEYHLENGQKPLPYDAWQFTLENAGLSSMISLFTIIIAAGIISNEFRWGSIKLLMIRPISRTKILITKYIAVLLFSLTMLIMLFATSLIIGMLFFGVNGINPSIVQMGADGVEEISVMGEIFTKYGLNMISLLMMATFAFMISTLFRSSGLAIGLAIFLMFAGNTVVGVLSEYEWSKYILFANTNLQQYMGANTPIIEGMTLGFSIIMLVIYFVLFLVISWISFVKRDIASN